MAEEEVWDLIRFGNLNTIAPLFDKTDTDLLNVVDQVSSFFDKEKWNVIIKIGWKYSITYQCSMGIQ